MKNIIAIGLLLLISACVHTKVDRTSRMTREIIVRPIVGHMSESKLLRRLLKKAEDRNCYSIEVIEISEGKAIGNCYDIVH